MCDVRAKLCLAPPTQARLLAELLRKQVLHRQHAIPEAGMWQTAQPQLTALAGSTSTGHDACETTCCDTVPPGVNACIAPCA